MRARGTLRLSQGSTLQKTADEFGAHLNSAKQWRQRQGKLDHAELRGTPTGRPGESTPQQPHTLGQLAYSNDGIEVALLRQIQRYRNHAAINKSAARRFLKAVPQSSETRSGTSGRV